MSERDPERVLWSHLTDVLGVLSVGTSPDLLGPTRPQPPLQDGTGGRVRLETRFSVSTSLQQTVSELGKYPTTCR